MGIYVFDANTAIGQRDISTYEAILAKAKSVEVPQYQEAMVYKNSIITGIQLAKKLVDEPGNDDLKQEYVRWLDTIDSKANLWRDKACGTEGQALTDPNQEQPVPGGLVECDPVATDLFWYNKLAPAHQSAGEAMSYPPDAALYGNKDGVLSETEVDTWIKNADTTLAFYVSLQSEAASICTQMKAMYEMWEDDLRCTRLYTEDLYIRENYDSTAICSPSEYRHPLKSPEGIPQVYLDLQQASGIVLSWDGVRR